MGSPAQRNISRRTRTPIPTAETLLRPTIMDSEAVQHKLSQERARQKSYADHSAVTLPTLTPGDTVRMQTDKGFCDTTATIVGTANPRSYVVQQNGKTYRRNRRHLLHVPTPDLADTVVPPPPTMSTTSDDKPGDPPARSTPADSAAATDTPVTVTRSGRAVVKPVRYRD